MKYLILENDETKKLVSKTLNYSFNKKTGFMATWGVTEDDDPVYSPIGPFIADIEITTSCTGTDNKLCKFCYKNNTPKGVNMSFENFKIIFDKLPKTLTQIAFGADSKCESNPDIWNIMDYCRNNKHNYVVPNITVAQISDEVADKLVEHCGAVAVSRYDNKNICYDSVKKLTDRGMKQVNIHIMLSEETYDNVYETFEDLKTDKRLEKLNCVVILSLKQKGRGIHYKRLNNDRFKQLIDYVFDSRLPVGFDSCTQPKFVNSIKEYENFKALEQLSEPCESGLFSLYIDTTGNFYPCSFLENVDNWSEGISVLHCNDFMKDIWNTPRVVEWRSLLLNNKRACPVYNI